MVARCEALISYAKLKDMKKIKRTKNIITNYEMLYSAWLEVRKGKTFTNAVVEYESKLAYNLTKLQKRLIDGTYKPKGYKEFKIYEPKERVIKAPYLEDRIVHHALLIAVGEKLDNRMIAQNFACRIGKGTHRASNLLKKYLIEYGNKGYVLKIDIRKFFYSLNHKVLERIVRKYIECEFAVNLFKMFYSEEAVGIPLGNVTSQVLANLYLNELDRFAKRNLKVKHYIRYMDDIVILHKSKKELRYYLSECESFIKESLKVETNEKTKIGRIKDGIDFVGYRTWNNRRIIRKGSLFRIKRKLKSDINLQRVSSFLSHSKGTNSIAYIANIIREISNTKTTNFLNNWIRKNYETV